MPKNTVDSKCWFNNVRNKPFTRFLYCVLNTLYVLCFNDQSTPIRECDFRWESDISLKGLNDGLDLPSITSKCWSRFSTIDGPAIDFQNPWLIKSYVSNALLMLA